jgi:putative membrane protein
MQWLLAGSLLLIAGGTAEAGYGRWVCPWRWGPGMMSGFPGGMAMMMVLLLLLGAVVVYMLLKRQGELRSVDSTRETPLEILKRRYAKGEITKEQYEEMKKDL